MAGRLRLMLLVIAFGRPLLAGASGVGEEDEEGRWVRCRVTEADEAGAPRAVSCGEARFVATSSVEADGAVEGEAKPGAGKRLLCVLGAGLCVLCAAFAAGLTLGLVSLDEFSLRVLCNRDVDSEGVCLDDRKEDPAKMLARERLRSDQRCARQILPLLSGHVFGERARFPKLNPTNGHVLLVTMLLLNSAANEALPLFLDELVPAWAAILLSVTVILLFGEILPSAVFTGPNQLQLAATLAPVVAVVRAVFFPVAGPISLLLDMAVGTHKVEEDRRGEIKAMAKTLQLQGLERDEVNMITGVLEMHAKTAQHISKPLEQAGMLAHDDMLDEAVIRNLLDWGHSRIFVYRRDAAEPSRRDDILGVLLVKKLLGIRFEEGRRVDSIREALTKPVVLSPDDNLLTVFDKFQAGTCHLAVVQGSSCCNEEASTCPSSKDADKGVPTAATRADDVLGVPSASDAVETRATMFCSLEDVIEALLKEDIFDEADAELGRVPVVGTPVSFVRGAAAAMLFRRGAGAALIASPGGVRPGRVRLPSARSGSEAPLPAAGGDDVV